MPKIIPADIKLFIGVRDKTQKRILGEGLHSFIRIPL